MISLLYLQWGIVKKQIGVFGVGTISGNIDAVQSTSRLIAASGKGNIKALSGRGGQKPLVGSSK